MSQNTVDYSGDPSGDELLDDLLTDEQENVRTSNSGTSRPSYAQAGMEWLDTTTNPWVLYRFDGTDDIKVGEIDTTANTFTPAGLTLDKTDATAAPTINDDDADGYTVGSKWVDVTNDRAYIAVDVSTGAAVWKEITGTVNGPSSSVDSEMVLFDGTTGRTIKSATGTGYVKISSGVMQTPAAKVPLTDLANQAAQSVLLNATGSSAAPTAVAVSADRLLGRGSGNVGEIILGTNLSMSGSTLNVDAAANNRQVFAASGTWNKPAGYDSTAMVLIEGWGAGGEGSQTSGFQGANGGSSSFGSHLIAYGGSGGASSFGGGAGGLFSNTNGRFNDAPTGEGVGGDGSSTSSTSGFYIGGGGGNGGTNNGGKSVYGGGGGAKNGNTGGTSVYGGNGASGTNAAGTAPGGGGSGIAGGGGGSYKYVWMPLSQLGSSETVTIGAGGTGTSGGDGARGEIRVTVFA